MLRTKSGLPKHCSWNTDRHGKKRVRFRNSGFQSYITGIPWSDDFMRQYAAALEGVKAQAGNIGADRTKPGSFSALCVSYYRAPDFRNLAPSTQAARRSIIERLRRHAGDLPLWGLKREHIVKMIDPLAPEAANNWIKTFRVLLAYAVDQGMIESNPADRIKKFKTGSDGHHTWTEAEVAQYKAHHPEGSKARLALELLLLGQRRGDTVQMGWQHISGDLIAVQQEKTGTPLRLEIHADLARELERTPGKKSGLACDRVWPGVHGNGLQPLVSRPLRRGKAAKAMYCARPAQAGRNAACQCGSDASADHGRHRTQNHVRSAAIHQGR